VYTVDRGESESAIKIEKYSVVVEIAGPVLRAGKKGGLRISRAGCVRPYLRDPKLYGKLFE
jgi:hypothetical protein